MQHGSFDKKAALRPATVCIRCSNMRNRKKKNLSPCGKRFSFYAPAGIRTLGISRKRLTASGGLKNLLRKLGVQCSNVRNRKKKNLSPCGKRFSFYAPAGIRTLDTRLKRAVLYLLSYWGAYSWDGGTRTHYIGVKVRCVTITLHPNIMAIQS